MLCHTRYTFDKKQDNHEQLIDEISKYFTPLGFESYPFKICWYNEKVSQVFRLPYQDDTLAFVILSIPDMFEKVFLPFINENKHSPIVNDPLDNSMIRLFNQFKKEFHQFNIQVFHDFELTNKRRPKIIMQTAGHVAGAAFHYKRSDVPNDPWKDKKIYGVSIHPKYGGWFGFRAVLVFSEIAVPNLKYLEPEDVVSSREKRIELLENYNFHWRDSKYRNVIPVEGSYSEMQKLYFDTKPKERSRLLEKWLN